MDNYERQILRAQLRAEFDRNAWRKKRIDEKLDRLAKEMEAIDADIAAETILRTVHEQFEPKRLLQMEMV